MMVVAVMVMVMMVMVMGGWETGETRLGGGGRGEEEHGERNQA